MALKVGLIGWRESVKKDMGYEIEDEVGKSFDEGPWEEFGELTEGDLEACFEYDFDDKIEHGLNMILGKGSRKGLVKVSGRNR